MPITMLETLKRIVQEARAATDLDAALNHAVQRIKAATQADVCSIYLTDFERRVHVLRATDGLNPNAVGRTELPLNRGLVGVVLEKLEPMNIDDAPLHPRYQFVSETDETLYHGFLGVPIIHNRKPLGVLVVRHIEPARFEEGDVTFLFTIATQLAAVIYTLSSGENFSDEMLETDTHARYVQGRSGSRGVAMGEIAVVYPAADLEAIPDRLAENPELEEDSFLTAVNAVKEDLKKLEERMQARLPTEDRALFQAWILMLESDTLIDNTLRRIRDGNWAPGALRETIGEHAKVFDQMEDEYLRERASDVRDLGRRILTYLQRDQARMMTYPDRCVLVGEEISGIQLAEVPHDKLAGVVSATGSPSSHVAILARAMGVPAVMGASGLPAQKLDGKPVIVDGYRGRIYIAPQPTVWKEYARLREEDRILCEQLQEQRDLPSETPDGIHIPLYLNTGLMISEMATTGMGEAAGVGLFRTEMPFMIRDSFPSEAVQSVGYRRILESFAPRPVTLRTLDIGGDKPLTYFPVKESNPFLGWRGIRISLDHPEIFLTQIRAMLRAAIGLDNLRILLPMISSVTELDEALRLIDRAIDELEEQEHLITRPKIGVMVEVPAAVYQVGELARRADFLSIGTNDLTQYLLAVDRNNAHVADLYNEFHPAVLRALVQVVEGAAPYGREVGVCGEMAGNPAATPLLIGMGVQHLSMNASSLLPVKAVVRTFTRSQARSLLKTALQKEDADSIRNLTYAELEKMNLGGLVRPGK